MRSAVPRALAAATVLVALGCGSGDLKAVSTQPGPATIQPSTAAVSSRSAAETIYAYFAAVNRRDWPQVWTLGGRNLSGSYREMVAGYARTERTEAFVYTDDGGGHLSAVLLASLKPAGVQFLRGEYTVGGGRILAGQLRLVRTIHSTRYAELAGAWSGHGRGLDIDASGIVVMSYRIYSWCTDDPTPPCDPMDGNVIINGGLVVAYLTDVSARRATAHVAFSTDPDVSGTVTLRRDPRRDTITASVFPGAPLCGPDLRKWICGA